MAGRSYSPRPSTEICGLGSRADVDPRIRLARPGTVNHPLGTDHLGRDVLSRVMWGGRISLMVGIVPVVLSAAGGSAVGLIVGYYGRLVDQAITRSLDVLLRFRRSCWHWRSCRL